MYFHFEIHRRADAFSVEKAPVYAMNYRLEEAATQIKRLENGLDLILFENRQIPQIGKHEIPPSKIKRIRIARADKTTWILSDKVEFEDFFLNAVIVAEFVNGRWDRSWPPEGMAAANAPSEPVATTPTAQTVQGRRTTHRKRAFVSHISEESAVAVALKSALRRDFLGLLDVFVSSDTDSISAGDDWLQSVEEALQQSALLIMLCSPASIRRPWMNFEAGAAWALHTPIIPVCHGGLSPRDLPVPLSLRQGIAIGDAEGLRKLYMRVARALMLDPPVADFTELATLLSSIPTPATVTYADTQRLEADREICNRLHRSLNHPDHIWRSLEWAAAEAGVSEEIAADVLRGNEDVRFGKAKSGKIIVGLTSRVIHTT